MVKFHPSKLAMRVRFPLPPHLLSSTLSCGLLTLTKPCYVFPHYMASFYKCACRSEFWIEYTDIGRQCRQKSIKVRHSIVFERCFANGLRRRRLADIFCPQFAKRRSSRDRVGRGQRSERRQAGG